MRIGTYARFPCRPHIPQIIDTSEARQPGCRVSYVDTGTERDYLDWLRAGDLDLVACWLPVRPPEFTGGPMLLREQRRS